MTDKERRYHEAIIAKKYDVYITRNRDDEEDAFRREEARQDRLDARTEWEADCKKDDELTNPKEEVIYAPEIKKELTEDELADVKHRMYKFEKEMRRQQDVLEVQRSLRGY